MGIKLPSAKFLDHMILFLLVEEGPLHGYRLTKSIEEKFGWIPSQTVIYNALKALESDACVTCQEKIETGRVQKIYSVTPEGMTRLTETKKSLQNMLFKRLSQMLRIMETTTDDIKKQQFLEVGELIRKIMPLTYILAQEIPLETGNILKEVLSQLQKLAENHKISLENVPEEFFPEAL